MWTLLEARNYLQDRLADDSTTFWASTDLDSYINEAQRQISALTKGVGYSISSTVSAATPYFSLPSNFVGAHEDGLYIDGGKTLAEISRQFLNLTDPDWRTRSATNPLWVSFDVQTNTAYVIPAPTSTFTVKGAVSVIPADLVNDADSLFGGDSTMSPYLEPLLSLSVAFALMKERYDGDAERFYSIYENQMRSLGINPDEIPVVPHAVPPPSQGNK